MTSPLTDDLKNFVREKIQSGEFPSEEAVVEAALRSLREQQSTTPDDFIDDEFIAFCDREGDDRVSLEQVLRATSSIPGSMAESIIDEERADRF